MKSDTQGKDSQAKPKTIQFVNWILTKLENRFERVQGASDNHQLISKLTFILVLGMSYELLGERVLSLVAVLL